MPTTRTSFWNIGRPQDNNWGMAAGAAALLLSLHFLLSAPGDDEALGVGILSDALQ